MLIRRVLLVLLLFVVCLTRAQTAPSLADIAREARASKSKPSSTSVPAPINQAAPTTDNEQAHGRALAPPPEEIPAARPYHDQKLLNDYEDSVRQLLEQGKFDQLDGMASELRASKARFAGGFWKIHIFYQRLYQPSGKGGEPSEDDYTSQIRLLEQWVAQRPRSITARVALAGAYLEYGGHARGDGYADTVTEEGWRLYGERAARAGTILAEASKLPEKCPEWYIQMQGVSNALGDQRMASAVFEKAAAFEPDYQYYYRIMAEHLKPKWGGDADSLAAFAAAAADHLGGERGDVIYYQIATFVNCACDNQSGLNGMSWERIKRGYQLVEKKYGPALSTLNQIAVLAAMAGDPDFTQQALDRIGEDWDKDAWRTRQYFDEVRAWAPGASWGNRIEGALQAADQNLATPEGQKFDANIAEAFGVHYSSAVNECYKLGGGASRAMPYQLAIQVGADGHVENAYGGPLTDVTKCLVLRIKAGRLPVPPKPSYWVKVSVHPVAQ